jgi:N-acetylglucosaminyldiphosphoundecaprenol N-acetyl-beta-D-mannosaminyltransferase
VAQEKIMTIYNVCDVSFNFVSFECVVSTVKKWQHIQEKHYISICNPHSVMLCRRDVEMRAATAAAEFVLPDGVGVILGARILGYANHGRVTGPALMLYLCDKGREYGWRHYFYGGGEGVADQLAARLSAQYQGLAIAGTYCPPFRTLSTEEDLAIVEQINMTQPDIVWVGLGAPKQEKWMAAHLGRLSSTSMVGVGAAFDFHSGNITWAPRWVRKLGVEWAYRLALEPRRMWRRNLDSPLFLLLVVYQRLRQVLGR